jgi:hypothetical protein
VTEAVPPGARASPPRDFTEFLIELSVALHKHAMSPEGHPSLGPAAEGVTRHAERLLGDRDLLAFGVARHQLIIEGVATDAQHPVLRRLAEGLHRHHLGAVSLLRGLQPAEVGVALRALSGEPDRDGPLPLSGGQLPGCDHVRLHLLTFDGLTIMGDEAQGGEASSASSRASDLWIGLARAALAGETDDDRSAGTGDGRQASTEPGRVADAIDRRQGAEAYDQVVVGYLLQIASELKTATGPEAQALRSRSARLIGALKPETLRRLVQMGGDAARRSAFVHDAAEGMAVEAVVDLVKAAADANGQTISHGLVRMLTKLSAHAEAGHDSARPAADSALREQVHSLLSEWDLADPNPDDYRRMLEYLATSTVSPEGGRSTAADDLKALRLVQMSLEVGTSGPLVDRAISTCLKEGGAQPLVALLEQAPEEGGVAAHRLRARLTQPMAIGAIASREPLDEVSLDYLMPSLSIDGYGTLLDVLASSRSRVTRRKLLDRLTATPLDVVPLVVSRLEDDRWFVQRNMLLLLGRVGRVPDGFPLARWTTHADARLRAEALRLQISLGQRELALRAAFSDADPRVVRVGLAMVQGGCPPRVLPFLGGLAQGQRVPEDLRLLAVQALGNTQDRAALDALIALADGGRNFLGRQKLAPKSMVVLAALRALASAWRKHPKAEPLLGLAAVSTDDDFREAVR